MELQPLKGSLSIFLENEKLRPLSTYYENSRLKQEKASVLRSIEKYGTESVFKSVAIAEIESKNLTAMDEGEEN